MKKIISVALSILMFIIYRSLKLITFAISVAFALLQFVLGIVAVILTLGVIGSATTKY